MRYVFSSWMCVLTRSNRKAGCDLKGEFVGEIAKPGIGNLSETPQGGKYDDYFYSYICY
jgi:hypothetical protein